MLRRVLPLLVAAALLSAPAALAGGSPPGAAAKLRHERAQLRHAIAVAHRLVVQCSALPESTQAQMGQPVVADAACAKAAHAETQLRQIAGSILLRIGGGHGLETITIVHRLDAQLRKLVPHVQALVTAQAVQQLPPSTGGNG